MPLKYAEAAYPDAEKGWYECTDCLSLIKQSAAYKYCPMGGAHHLFGDNHWAVTNNLSAPGEHGWRECSKCGSLFYPHATQNVCAALGQHDGSSSADYAILADVPDLCLHRHWHRCTKCGVLYGPLPACNPSPSSCAAGRAHTASLTDYSVIASWVFDTVLAEGCASNGTAFSLGGSATWGGGLTTPHLRWFDATETLCRIYTRPFAAGDASISVELLVEKEIWVDFNNLAGPWRGTFDYPYKTFDLGVTATPYGGTLSVKPGTSSELGTFPMLLPKRMTIQAPLGGLVTIGR
jgi:uncharacterized OB-fold protein